jgi:hypothetical protein
LALRRLLLRKNEEGNEKCISFLRKSLKDAKMKYEILEKHTYALDKALKSFRVYVLQSIITTYVPKSSVKKILVQLDSEGKRGKWIVKI